MIPEINVLKIDFREFCVVHLYIRNINDIFTSADIEKGKSEENLSGDRRTLVEDYYASLDWQSINSVRKFVNVLNNTLGLHWLDDEAKQELHKICKKHNFLTDTDNGYEIYLTTTGVEGKVKNLIFAANGPKPEIIFTDSVSNDIKVVKNASYCLIYDRPISPDGLLWGELVDWWKETNQLSIKNEEVGKKLYSRLLESLDSKPEKLLLHTYFKEFHKIFREDLPALVPQVYLHYDPYTIKQLRNQRRLMRQRMDFLLLLSDRIRIVIEIDGKQHYSEQNEASPKLYSDMVSEDRQLKLSGYEVYRFGGYELSKENATEVVSNFFIALFRRHGIAESVA